MHVAALGIGGIVVAIGVKLTRELAKGARHVGDARVLIEPEHRKRLEAPRYEVATALEQAALAELRERRPDRAIETNVEFWAAVILDFAEVPAKMMPAMFTCGRTAGWCAHILEQKRLGKLVRPSAIYVGPGPRSPESVAGWDEIARR